MKINLNRLKNYLSDLDPDTSIVDEAIATIEAVAENKTDDELYERERPLMIAYLALRIVKAGLNVSTQNNEVRGEWCGSVCSECGESTSFWYDCNYCPHCGAEMSEREGTGNE